MHIPKQISEMAEIFLATILRLSETSIISESTCPQNNRCGVGKHNLAVPKISLNIAEVITQASVIENCGENMSHGFRDHWKNKGHNTSACITFYISIFILRTASYLRHTLK